MLSPKILLRHLPHTNSELLYRNLSTTEQLDSCRKIIPVEDEFTSKDIDLYKKKKRLPNRESTRKTNESFV